MTFFAQLALVVSLWLLVGRAAADDTPPGYREAIDEALAELSQHHYEEARALFARAHGLYPNARTLRGLGFADFELRHYVACIEQLTAALEERERPLDAALRADTEHLLARARTFVGRVELEARPAAFSLLVDGAERPLGELTLDPGQHQLELFAAGYEPERRTVNVAGGSTQTLTVVFMHGAPSRDAPRRLVRNPWLWTALGAVVAGAAVGTYFALRDPGAKTEAPWGGSAGLSLGGGR